MKRSSIFRIPYGSDVSRRVRLLFFSEVVYNRAKEKEYNRMSLGVESIDGRFVFL